MYFKSNFRYAAQYLQKNRDSLKPSSRVHKWKEATDDEMKRFFSLMLVMELVQMQDDIDCWSNDPIFGSEFFNTVMPQSRFELLMYFLQFSDISNYIPLGEEGHDPLYKLGSIYHDITNLFTDNYYPTKNIALIGGFVPSKSTMDPRRSNSSSMKSYGLYDETGYCCKYQLYTGRHSDTSKQSGTYELCMSMMDDYLNKGHHLYVGIAYTSPLLFLHLYQKGTGACGPLKFNQKDIPESTKLVQPAKGESLVVSNGPLMVFKYHGNTRVTMCSTVHKGTMVDSDMVNRKSNKAIKMPDALVDHYKINDLVEANVEGIEQSFAIMRDSLPWYKSVMFRLFHECNVQAYIVYKMKTDKPVTQKVFQRELVDQMIAQ